MTPVEKEEILTFLSKNPLGVISTLHEATGAPEAALIAFAETSDFKIIFQTMNDARKYTNLKHDSRIAFTTGGGTEKLQHITFQYEGVAREVEPINPDYKKYRAIFENKDTPCTIEFLDNPRSRIFVASPTWCSYSDYTKEKVKVVQYNF
jgi:uncharacterized pyridoxamine 5'-phosphate oxidase family protein